MSEPVERSGIARWAVSFGAVVAAHAVLAWSVLHLQPSEGLPAGEPVMLQLEPPLAAPQQEAAPSEAGPEQTQTAEIPTEPDKTEPEPEPEPEPEHTAEVPPEPEKEPEETVAQVEPEPVPLQPAPPEVTPEVAVAPPEPPMPPPKPKLVEKEVEKKKEKPKPKPKPRRTVTRTTAPSAASQPSQQPSARSGAASNNASLASWRAALSAHLQRNKRYPAEAQARGQTGTAMLTFTIDRNGRVLGSSVGSSGHAALDQEARDLIRRAQPLPSAPADVAGNRFPFSVPIRFSAAR